MSFYSKNPVYESIVSFEDDERFNNYFSEHVSTFSSYVNHGAYTCEKCGATPIEFFEPEFMIKNADDYDSITLCAGCLIDFSMFLMMKNHLGGERISESDFCILVGLDWEFAAAKKPIVEDVILQHYIELSNYREISDLITAVGSQLFFMEIKKTPFVSIAEELAIAICDEGNELATFLKKILHADYKDIVIEDARIAAKYLADKTSAFDEEGEDVLEIFEDSPPEVHSSVPTFAPAVSFKDISIHKLFYDMDLTSMTKKTGSYVDFYKSLRVWFETKHMLTDKQMTALEKMHYAYRKEHNFKNHNDTYLLYMK